MSEWIGCDKCSVASACYEVKGMEGELYFCHHHYQEHRAALEGWAYEVIDLQVKVEEPV